jgi:hypothetical protein
MVFNAPFNNISVISWLLVLLVEETWVSGKKTSTCHKSPVYHGENKYIQRNDDVRFVLDQHA